MAMLRVVGIRRAASERVSVHMENMLAIKLEMCVMRIEESDVDCCW